MFGFQGPLVAQMPPKLRDKPPCHLSSCPWLFHEEHLVLGSCLYGMGSLQTCGHLPLLTCPFSTGRDLQENSEALEEFKEFTQLKGLVPENLVMPEQMGECTCNPCSPLCPL